MAYQSSVAARASLRKNKRILFSPTVEALEQRTLFSNVGFAPAVTSTIATLGFPVVATATGDLNGDGVPDLVAAGDNLEAQVFIGSATGVLTPGSIVATGGDVIALGEFTGSGNLDLATPNGVLPGNGDGTFGTVIAGFTLPTNTVNMYAVDTNGDGLTDLVCITYTPASSNGNVQINPTIAASVLIGVGNGTFRSALTSQISSAANLTAADATAAFGEFTSNGELDMVTPFGLMLGNNNGTFAPPVAFPFSAGSATGVPSGGELAIGDFNDDSNLDVATLAPGGVTNAIEVFLGNGKGGFTDNGEINVGSGETITSLAASDFVGSGNADIVAGIVSTGTTTAGAASIDIFNNTGNAAFQTPTPYAIDGPSVSIVPEFINTDTTPDLLSIDQAAGSAAGTGASTAAVLLATVNAGVAPAITIHSTVNPVVAANAYTLLASVQELAGSTLTATPTGNVTFYDDAASLGTVTLTNGKATLALTATDAQIGTQTITAVYSGDANYASATSSNLSLIVLATSEKIPVFSPAIGVVTLPTEFLPGDKGSISVEITNEGDASGGGKLSIDLYLSPDGVVDSSAIALTAPSLQNRSLHLGIGKSATFKTNITAASYPAGTYYLLAQLVAGTGIASENVSQTAAASAITYQAAGMVFGDVGSHKGLRLKTAGSNGSVATLSITGPGAGTLTQTGGVDQITVTGTTAASHVTLSGSLSVDTLDITGPINTIEARGMTLTGGLTVGGGAKTIVIAGALSTDGSNIAITTGAGVPTAFTLGNVGNVTLTDFSEIKTLTANAWQAGAIDAPSIGNLVVNDSFGADIRVHDSGKLTSAKIGAVTGGTWAIAGDIGTIKIAGAVTGLNLFAGADTGPDDALDTSDDIFAPASIGSLFVGGAVNSSLIVAGGSFPAMSNPISASLSALPDSAIRSIVVDGTLSSDTEFFAAHLPQVVKVDGSSLRTAVDARFKS